MKNRATPFFTTSSEPLPTAPIPSLLLAHSFLLSKYTISWPFLPFGKTESVPLPLPALRTGIGHCTVFSKRQKPRHARCHHYRSLAPLFLFRLAAGTRENRGQIRTGRLFYVPCPEMGKGVSNWDSSDYPSFNSYRRGTWQRGKEQFDCLKIIKINIINACITCVYYVYCSIIKTEY